MSPLAAANAIERRCKTLRVLSHNETRRPRKIKRGGDIFSFSYGRQTRSALLRGVSGGMPDRSRGHCRIFGSTGHDVLRGPLAAAKFLQKRAASRIMQKQ